MAQSSVEYPKEVVVDLTEKSPIQVLHVDDEAGFLKAAKPCLEMQGAFQVDTALSVEEALEKMRNKTYDVVVSDYIMPGKDGLQFLKELRDSGNSIPFIMFTGKGREEVAIEALNLGADQYVNKIGSPEVVYSELAHGIRKVVKTKRAEEALWRSEERYRSLFLNMLDGFAYCKIILDEKGKPVDFVYLEVNDAFERLTGLKKEDVLGRKVTEAIPGIKAAHPELFDVYGRVALTGKEEEFDIYFKPLDIWLSISVYSPKKGYFVEVFENITERKKIEEELKESENRFKTLFEDSPNGLFFSDFKGVTIDTNKALDKLIGCKRKETVGKNFFELGLIPNEQLPKAMELMGKMASGQPTNPEEFAFNRKGGDQAFVEIRVFPVRIKDQVFVLGSVTDITESKQREEELRSSEERLKILFEFAPDAYYLNDLKGNFIDGNKAAEELMGYNRSELVGKNFLKLKLLPRRQIPKAAKLLALNAFGKPTGPDEFVLNRKDGAQVPVEIRTYPVKIKGQTLVLGIARDITERKKAEVKLRESEKKFRNIFENANDAIIYGDLKGTILDLNQKAVELAGIEKEKILGKSFRKLGLISLRDVPKLLGRLARKALGKAETEGFQLTITRKDGKKRFLEVNSTLIRKGKMPAGFLAIARDVTGRRKTLKKLEMMNEKLGVVGKLTRHDARNKLSTVTMNAYMAKQKLAGDHEALEHLSEIESAAGQVEEIFEFARIYERIGVEELAYINVEKNLRETVMLFSDLHDVEVINDCRGLTVLADSLLRQIFYNLIDNSLKHGGKISQIRVYYEAAGKDKVKLMYEDDGIGIRRSEKKKIFMEGYGKGTGYGLYLIRKMCEVYGWTIRETGKQGRGAQFTMAIPKMGEDGRTKYELH